MNFWREKKVETILFATILFGFILRLINVYTKKLLGDPPHFAIEAINFFDSGLLIVWDQSTYLWYAFTSIFYSMFGITQFATRFSSLLFGTLCIIALYLFVKEFSGSRKLAVLSSIIFAFAPGIIIQTADEHDISVLFFILMSFYALIYSLKNNSRNYLYVSAVIFGVAAMWKAYLAVLMIPYIGLIVYYKYKEKIKFKNYYKKILPLIFIIILLVSPTLVYNYLNYKHNGVVDFLFATSLSGISNEKMKGLYGWTAGNEINKGGNKFTRTFFDLHPNDPSSNKSALAHAIPESIFSNGIIIWSLAILGFLYMYFRRKEDVFAKDYIVFFSLYFFIPFLYMIEGNFLNKHYLHFMTFAIPMSSYFLIAIYNGAAGKFKQINKLGEYPYIYLLYALYVAFVVFVLMSMVTPRLNSFYSENPQNDLINYKVNSIEKQSLIIYDDRIYNSEAGWLFSDRYYIPVSFLTKFMEYNNQSNNKVNVPVYIVECASDDCGWGTVSRNPALNKSMEDFFDSVKNQNIEKVLSTHDKVSGVSYYNPLVNGKMQGPEYYAVYKTAIAIDLSIAQQVKLQYEYFLYPTEYLNKNSETFKNFIYTPRGMFENTLNDIAWLVFYLNILISFAVILLLIYEFYIQL